VRRHDPDAVALEAAGPPEISRPAGDVIATLAPMVTERRLARMRAVVAERTRRVVPLLERLADPHNASAILRSCDAFGLQQVHVVPGEHGFFAARTVAMGSNRWLDLAFHETAEAAATRLRADGYGIYVGSMEGSVSLAELAAREERIAVVFGHEREGPSEAIRAAADGTFSIAMRGFVESLNVSVAAAITLHALTQGRPSELDEAARDELLARFLKASVRDADRVLRDALG